MKRKHIIDELDKWYWDICNVEAGDPLSDQYLKGQRSGLRIALAHTINLLAAK